MSAPDPDIQAQAKKLAEQYCPAQVMGLVRHAQACEAFAAAMQVAAQGHGDQLHEMRCLLYEDGWDSVGQPQDRLRVVLKRWQETRDANIRITRELVEARAAAQNWERVAQVNEDCATQRLAAAQKAEQERDEALQGRLKWNDWRNHQSALDLALSRAQHAEEKAEAAEERARQAAAEERRQIVAALRPSRSRLGTGRRCGCFGGRHR